jgi:agmatine/peptidylarginine deiminase
MTSVRRLCAGFFSSVMVLVMVPADHAVAEGQEEAGPGGAQQMDEEAVNPVPRQSYAPHTPQFPWHFFSEFPWTAFNAFRSDPSFTQWPWLCDPEYKHDTGPTPDEYHYLGEFDLTNGVLFGMPEWGFGCFMSDQLELMRASMDTGAEVTILTAPKLIPNVKRCLRANGFTGAEIERINFAPVKVDSIWIRDYGPEFQSDRDDHSARAVVSPTYNGTLPRPDNCRPLERGPLTYGRSNDDASPTRLADLVERDKLELRGVDAAEVYRAPLVFEGGNIFTDGEGRCFRNRDGTNRLNTEAFFGDGSIAGSWTYTEDEIDAVIAEYYNCDEGVVVLDSVQPTSDRVLGGALDHIDMTVTFLSSDTVLVGAYAYQTEEDESLTLVDDVPDDPVNAAILDDNADLLEELGYNVVRIPMPVPFCTRGWNCVPDYERDLTGETIVPCPDEVYDDDGTFVGGADPTTGEPFLRTWATFANSIRIGDSLMMPSYPESAAALDSDLGQLLLAQEQEAQRVYQQELDRLYGDGAVTVVPVASDGLAPCNGSLQCITKTY